MLQVKLNISLICCSLRDFTLIQRFSFLIGLVFLNYEESLAARLIGFSMLLCNRSGNQEPLEAQLGNPAKAEHPLCTPEVWPSKYACAFP